MTSSIDRLSRFFRRALLATLPMLAVAAAQAQTYTPYTVTTIAGSPGFVGSTDDVGPLAKFSSPFGTAVDNQGNLYVADGNNHRVRKITLSTGFTGTLATGVSGGGSFGVIGGVAIDKNGVIYATDQTSGAVYKITSAGVASTFFGGGVLNTPSGIAVDASGNVYVADTGNAVIRKITSGGVASILAGSVGNQGTANGTGSAASFEYPVGIAVSAAGDLYVTDTTAATIRKVTSAGSVTTYAGQPFSPGTADGAVGGSLFNQPLGIAVDSSGNLYVTDYGKLVREISAAGTVTTLAGSTSRAGSTNGAGSSALFSFSPPSPAGLAVDNSGNLFIADTSNNTIREAVPAATPAPQITSQPQNLTVFAGASATFTVAASGTGLSYQWTRNGAAITNATSASYVIAATALTDAGSFQVSVVNAGGQVFSNTVTLTVNPAPVAPSITIQPQSQVVTAGAGVTFTVSASGTAPLSYQWSFNGQAITGATAASYSIGATTSGSAGFYAVTVTNPATSVTSNNATLTVNPVPVAPAITTQPQSQTVKAGTAVTFTAAASGTPAPSYQWYFNGTAISGVTSASYSLNAASIGQSGSYTVTATNASGSATSNGAVLAVQTTGAPAVGLQPQSQTIATGSTLALTVTANGTVTVTSGADAGFQAQAGSTTTYQWYLNGVPVSGATSATLLLPNVTLANSGSYTCLITNALGSTLSSAAVVTVATTSNPGRLINLSVLSVVKTSLTMGFVVGGSGASGSESLLMRATGPALALAPFGVAGVMIDPTLTVVRQGDGTTIATNSGWGTPSSNQALVTTTDAAVGAFALTNPSSLDSALVASLPISVGGYTATVAGKTGDSGYALTEAYDATPAGTYTLATPRLVNLSCLTPITAGGTLTVGFVLGGATSKTLLIRVSGPTLAGVPFNIAGTMPDPQFTVEPLNSPTTILASNAGWAGSAQVASVASTVGAFAFAGPTTLDSATVVTLAPGIPYTVQATSVSGVGGLVLVEIYEVP